MRTLLHLLLVVIGWTGSVRMSQAQTVPFDGFIVIANQVGSAWLTDDDALSALRGKKSVWANGKPVLVVFPNTRHEGSKTIARQLFSTDPLGMHRYWLSLVFQGRANAPVFVEDWDAVVRKVREVEGAIAVVPRGTAVPEAMLISLRKP